MASAASYKQHNAPHPGELIKRVYMEPLNLSMEDCALKLGITAEKFQQLIDGKIDVDKEWSVRLSKGFGRSPESWLLMQENHTS
jgi:antitoxin HigA-1